MAKDWNYPELLKDPRWQRKRLEIFQRDNFTCLYCEDSRTHLAIHHIDYNGNPWDVPNDLLQTICLHCHDIMHALPGLEITDIHKQISINNNCWECVAFTENKIIYLYLFFEENPHTDKCEIISIHPLNNAA